MTAVTLVLALVLVPLAVGALLWCTRSDAVRKALVGLTVLAVSVGSLALAGFASPLDLSSLPFNAHSVSRGMLFIDIAIGLYVIYVGVRSRRPLIVGLMLAQAGLMVWFEQVNGAHVEVAQNLFVDKFSVIMALINGLVGGGICLYALGYMREYHEVAHPDIVDRRPYFFALLFVFMSAMFGLVFSNNLLWLLFFWEITTLCSFLLIGYTQTPEAQNNALRALVMNLAGGLAFALAIVWLFQNTGHIELQALITSDKSLVLLPVALLCFAGITKSAQMPFSSWLLGAMVAPTPVSALLHSSTMVKAGVYLVLRLGPVLMGTKVGLIVAMVGGTTFVVGSLAAITTGGAKKVLAYSTVANLGLIVLCGGIGTAEAIWAGVLLVIFHAVAKCLLFLCVGVVEHKLHTRDIEAMSGLVLRLPRVAMVMLIGMAGMFLAPFGMLISKWAVLKAVVDAAPLLSVFIVFGSSATLFFWVKWMGKLVEVIEPYEPVSQKLALGESVALYGLALATFMACLFFPLISTHFIEPYVVAIYGQSVTLGQGNIIIMTIMMALVMLFPIAYLNPARGVRVVAPYLGGANVRAGVSFLGSADEVQKVSMENYYLRSCLNEAWLTRWGVYGSTVLLLAMALLATFKMNPWLSALIYVVAAPVVGGLLAGWDRRITARMQSRQGPPIFQPFYDVLKLCEKERIVVRRRQNLYILFFLALVIFTGALFFAGLDLLLVIFALTLAAIFFVLGAYKASSPYSFIGAERELIQMMAYEPMILLTAIGMYIVTKSFHVSAIAAHPTLLVLMLPGVFLGFLYTLEIKFRKSPFDLSCSHHAHQELVKGITTEFSGRALAMIEIAHWYENVFLLGWVYLFFASVPALGVAVSLLVFVFVILVDNVFARLKWQTALRSAWIVAAVLGFGNILILSLLR